MDGPLEIFLEKPTELTFETARETLMHVVPLCLDNDHAFQLDLNDTGAGDGDGDEDGGTDAPEPSAIEDDPDREPDDFSFWSEKQAKRICLAIRWQAFDVGVCAGGGRGGCELDGACE
ncbi:hypothetical protein H0H92_005515 [Tricholoma furcatifolium]|nr:hypothetical protein H0H92_005515 [Tricholoma furcatifolium]